MQQFQTRLSEKALEMVSQNPELKAKIAIAMNRSAYTIQRWVNDNDVMLTTADALRVIQTETGLVESELLEEVTA